MRPSLRSTVFLWLIIDYGLMVDESLKSEVSEFIDAAVQVLSGKTVPVIQESRCYIPRQGRTELRNERKQSYEATINENRSQIEELSAFDECIAALRSDDLVAKYHSSADLSGILRQFLADLIEASEGSGSVWSYHSDEFNTLYKKYECWLRSDTLPRKKFVALQGLQYDTNTFRFNECCQIQRVTGQVLTSIIQSSSGYGSLPDEWSPTRTQYLLEVSYEAEKTDQGMSGTKNTEISAIRQKIDDAVTALRLTHDGMVGYSTEYTFRDAPWEQSCGSRTLANFFPLFQYGSLVMNDGPEAQRLYDLLNLKTNSAREPDVAMSIERFNSSYIRENDRVRFSDLMTILEALVSKKYNISKSMQAQRVAILLGDSLDERRKIFETYNDLYDERSAVWGVGHGGGRTTLSEESLNTAQEYVKRLIITILEQEQEFDGHGDLINQLEKEIEKSYLNVDFL